MGFKFKNSENEQYRTMIISEFLKNPNPFPRNATSSRDNLPKFCLGRKEEIGIIKNAIEKVSSSIDKKSNWIPINGSGGTGKSTIALYVYDSTKRKKSKDLDIDYLECSYFDCPSEHKFLTISYLYKKILQDLGTSPDNYPYFLGLEFIKKLFAYFDQEDRIKNDFFRKFSHVWDILLNSKDHTDFVLKIKKKAPNFAKELKVFVNDYDFIFSNNPDIKLETDYMMILIDLVSADTRMRRAARSKILGNELKNEEEAINLLRKLISTLNFIFKKSCLLIIIDNFEYLPEDDKAFKALFKILLKFRNSINNCLLLTIGSTDFWVTFNERFNQSKLNMLLGFKIDDISLKNISSKDASKIMNRYISEFWDSVDKRFRPKGDDFRFPFSLEAFEYIYEINGRNLRKTLKNLYKIVEGYKSDHKIDYMKDTKDSIFYLRLQTQEIYLSENELVYLEDFISRYHDRNQLSRNIENGLFRAFSVIKENSSIGKMIYDVKHEPTIKIDSGSFAKPDVYLELFGDESLQDFKKIEISVKAYYSSNKVPKSEIDGSLALLNEREIDYLTFITLSPLENRILKVLDNFGPQIGRISNLTNEEACYLLLLTKDFSELFFKMYPLDCDKYIQILDKIGINLEKFLQKIRKIKIEKPIKIPIEEDEGDEVVKGPKSEEPPIHPEEKISNPKKLEPMIIKLLKEYGSFNKKQEIIDSLSSIAKSQNTISSAISNLRSKNLLDYSRKKGWFLIE